MPSVVFENRSSWPHREVEIYIDGVNVGRANRNDTFETIVDPGVHSFRIRADHGAYSMPIELRLERREAAGFLGVISGMIEKRVDFVLVFHHRPHDRFDEHELVRAQAAEESAAAEPYPGGEE
jgi:hypothetical protein